MFQWRSKGAGGGATAPGRRPKGGAKIQPKILKKRYKEKLKKYERMK